jgi:hypothetical protein
MSVGSRSGMILTGETEEFREETLPVSLRPPQIAYGLTQVRTQATAVTGRRLNCLGYCTT